jgi:aryl-phospho-beta-D-glucosidase BglC (GH1 family)
VDVRGVNFGGWFSQIDAVQGNDPERFPGEREHIRTFLGPEDFRRVKGWGFDHVRLPVDWQTVFDARDLSPREENLSLLDAAIDGLLGAGLEVMFDLHKCPGHDFHEGTRKAQPFFTDPAHRRDCLKVWAHLAARYGGRPGVMLEVLNEPVAPSFQVWNEVQAELAAALRRMAPRATLVLGSNLWNGAAGFEHLTPIADENVLYSFHFYNPIIFTHQFAPWIEGDHFQARRTYPGTYVLPPDAAHRLPLDTGRWDEARLAVLMQHVFRFRERHRVRVACNEFGVYVGGPDRDSQLAWMRDVMELFREHEVGWSYWTYKNLDFGLVSRGEGRFEGKPQYDNPERLDRELVELLRRY